MNFRRYVMMCPSIFSLNREALLVNETAKHCLSMKPRSTACQWVGNCHFIIQISMNAKCFSIILEVSTNSLLPPGVRNPGVRPSGHTSRGLMPGLGKKHAWPFCKAPGQRPRSAPMRAHITGPDCSPGALTKDGPSSSS